MLNIELTNSHPEDCHQRATEGQYWGVAAGSEFLIETRATLPTSEFNQVGLTFLKSDGSTNWQLGFPSDQNHWDGMEAACPLDVNRGRIPEERMLQKNISYPSLYSLGDR